MAEIPLSCQCGAVRGRARDPSPRTGVRLVCMCDDCQTFAHYLGRANELLDANGGSDVFQFTQARITFDEGMEHLRCLRQSPRGTLRWYAECCNTPVANLMTRPSVAFASISVRLVDLPPSERDAVLGPVRARVNARFGQPPLPPDAHPRASLATIWRSLRHVIWARMRGEHRPTPFHGADGRPTVEPIVLTLEERNELRSKVAAPRAAQ